jgi:hypothetical protein
MSASRRARFRAAAIAGVPIAAIVLATLSPSVNADVDSVAGGGYAATVQSSLLGTVIAPTPNIIGSATEPTNSFGPINQSSVPVDIVGLLHIGVLNAFTQGGGVAADEPAGHLGFAETRTSVADVVVGLGALSIDAVESSCRSDGNGSTAFVELVGAVLGGNPLLTSPLPNTTVTLPGILSIVLNEQIRQDTVGLTAVTVRAAHITVLPGLAGLLGVVDIILAESRCIATGPDVNVAPTTTAAPTTTTTIAATTTTAAPATTTTTAAPGTTTTTAAPATTTTTAAPGTTTTTAAPATTTTAAPIVTTTTALPPAGTTIPLATTTTAKPVAPPLPRTGSSLMPMVGLAMLAIALGTLVRRSAEAMAPAVEVRPVAPPVTPEFRPIDARPSAIRRRSRRNPLDPAVSDALSAFDDDTDEDGDRGGTQRPT